MKTKYDIFDEIVQAEMAERQIPGVALAVQRNGKAIKCKGYGVANLELSTPVTSKTVFQLASVTKQFTATAIMLLVTAGKLTLDSTLGELLDDMPNDWHPVTVRQLLTHTSGIVSFTDLPNYFEPANMRLDFAPREILQKVDSLPLQFAPGSQFHYNNSGYLILGMVIEKVSGMSYAEYLAEQIFVPVGMTQTRLNDWSAVVPHRANGYMVTDGVYTNAEYLSPSHSWAAGAILSSVRDMALWDNALRGNAILSSEVKKEMWEPTTLSDGATFSYGFGWGVEEANGQRAVQHGGGIPGFSTFFLRQLDQGGSIIVLANLESGDAGSIALKIAAILSPN